MIDVASSPGPPRYIYAFIIRATFEPLDIERAWHVSDVEGREKVYRESVGERDRNNIHAYASIHSHGTAP